MLPLIWETNDGPIGLDHRWMVERVPEFRTVHRAYQKDILRWLDTVMGEMYVWSRRNPFFAYLAERRIPECFFVVQGHVIPDPVGIREGRQWGGPDWRQLEEQFVRDQVERELEELNQLRCLRCRNTLVTYWNFHALDRKWTYLFKYCEQCDCRFVLLDAYEKGKHCAQVFRTWAWIYFRVEWKVYLSAKGLRALWFRLLAVTENAPELARAYADYHYLAYHHDRRARDTFFTAWSNEIYDVATDRAFTTHEAVVRALSRRCARLHYIARYHRHPLWEWALLPVLRSFTFN